MQKPSTYEDCLRAIGHEIDKHDFRAFAIGEDSEAIWVLLLRKTGRKRHRRWHFRPEALEHLLQQARSRRGTGHPGFPRLNYENVLRLVGHELDRCSCQSLLLMESNGEVAIRYAMASSSVRPYSMAFSVADLEAMLARAYERRSRS